MRRHRRRGTTGESPTLTEAETAGLVRAVVARTGDRARVIAGVGTYDTAASIRRARDAEAAGADALLLVCPYYSRPTQAGVVAHCAAVADATALPVMLYDVPARAGVEMTASTLIELAGHPRIHAVKDAKGDLFEAMSVLARTSLAYYCGIDELNLPYLACGAAGLVSVIGNAFADRNAELIRAVRGGDLGSAKKIQEPLIPLVEAVMRTAQGATMTKAALAELGIIRTPSCASRWSCRRLRTCASWRTHWRRSPCPPEEPAVCPRRRQRRGHRTSQPTTLTTFRFAPMSEFRAPAIIAVLLGKANPSCRS